MNLVETGLGIASLFPLAGSIENLRGFYPKRLRKWFVTLSTVFSLVVYVVVTFQFENLKTFVAVRSAAILAAVLMVIYIVVHLATNSTVLPRVVGALVIAGLLLTYCGAIACLTYTFNVLNQLRAFAVYSGRVLAEDTSEPLEDATVTLLFVSGAPTPTTTRTGGRFIAVVPRQRRVAAMQIVSGEPSTANSYCYTVLGDKVPHDEPFTVRVGRCKES